MVSHHFPSDQIRHEIDQGILRSILDDQDFVLPKPPWWPLSDSWEPVSTEPVVARDMETGDWVITYPDDSVRSFPTEQDKDEALIVWEVEKKLKLV